MGRHEIEKLSDLSRGSGRLKLATTQLGALDRRRTLNGRPKRSDMRTETRHGLAGTIFAMGVVALAAIAILVAPHKGYG